MHQCIIIGKFWSVRKWKSSKKKRPVTHFWFIIPFIISAVPKVDISLISLLFQLPEASEGHHDRSSSAHLRLQSMQSNGTLVQQLSNGQHTSFSGRGCRIPGRSSQTLRFYLPYRSVLPSYGAVAVGEPLYYNLYLMFSVHVMSFYGDCPWWLPRSARVSAVHF